MSKSLPSIPQCQLAESQILDLHGNTKEKAIQKLTFFLDQIRHKHLHSLHAPASSKRLTYLPVSIITGSGKHSQNGPVLRTAVQKTLTKRQMTFRFGAGKGSFLVDALSGIELRERRGHGDPSADTTDEDYDSRCAKDSKVLVKRQRDRIGVGFIGGPQHDVRLVNRPNNTLLTRPHQPVPAPKPAPAPKASISAVHSDRDDEATTNLNEEIDGILSMPTPSEAKWEEEQIKDAKQLSEKEASLQYSLETKESKILQKATEDSVHSHREIEEERKKLQDILEMSKREEEHNQKSEEEMIEEALKLSTQDNLKYTYDSEDERLQLEKVLAMSRNCKQDDEDEDEDLLLLEALKESRALANNESARTISRNESTSFSMDNEFERQLKIAMNESNHTF